MHPTTQTFLNINKLRSNSSFNPTTPKQGRLDLTIKTAKEVDGIGMGVLSDGTAYLTARGLAKLCGIDHTAILDIGNGWSETMQPPRVTKIKEIMYQHGNVMFDNAYIEILENNTPTRAYPEFVCLAVLEYYAFEAGQNIKQTALNSFRRLAGGALRDFIYNKVGYTPDQNGMWGPLMERLSTAYDAAPVGYFSVFKETVELAVSFGEVGLHVNQGFVHDISVGQCWAKYWADKSLSQIYGDRIKYLHKYPPSYSQHLSNPQEPWAYPESALPAFKKWLREDYVSKGKLKSYLSKKVSQSRLPSTLADKACLAYESRFIKISQ